MPEILPINPTLSSMLFNAHYVPTYASMIATGE